MNKKGYIHSIETFGTLDGPGLRTVVFFQGCPLKCQFCHNLDCTLSKIKGEEYTLKKLTEKVLKNKAYWGDKGGVTVSGGEPTFQPEFLLDFLKELKSVGVNTAIDSCLFTSKKILESVSSYVDYWMVSVKHMDKDKHKELTGVTNTMVLENIQYLDKQLVRGKSLRIRFVVIPGITDSIDHIRELGKFISRLKHLDHVELLPYGSHGAYKWEEIFGKYPLEDIREATSKDLKEVKIRLQENNNFDIYY